ncbi:MAG TPA: cytochrome c oxidase subunit 3 [Terriglobales bacterium]|nr:cytochrome c oxidase subunit 3 [Terriglobales bacterium]
MLTGSRGDCIQPFSMATLNPSVHSPRTSFGRGPGGPNNDPPFGGGGGGGQGDSSPDYGEQLRKYRLGMGVALVAIFMLFLSFTIAFVIRQVVGSWNVETQSYVHDWVPVTLPLRLLLLNTALLLVSSFTLEKSRRQAFQRAAVSAVAGIPGVTVREERSMPWLGITLALGFAFVAGQFLAWRELMSRGFYISGNPNSSFFYVLTGMHAIHLVGGLIALLYGALFVHSRLRGLERRRVVLDVTAWYWHSMSVLWVYIFALLILVR